MRSNWESNATEPEIRFLPAIIRFLGYNPLPESNGLLENFTRLRKSLGLSQRDLAEKLGIDESTIAHWEQGENTPAGPYRNLIESFINS